jgi:CheY-like chemotaxis protein
MEKMVSFAGAIEVLVVDDNEINRNLSSILMKGFGVRVDEADSAYSAIEKAQHRQYDLILMDVHMPQMDGIEATRKIRNMGKPNDRTPIVALTADIVADRRRYFLESGMNDYLAKPIEEHALVSIFLKWCPDKARPGSLLREKSIGRLDTAGIEEVPVLDTVLGLRYSSGTDAVWKKSLSLLIKKLHNDTAALDELTVGGKHRQIAEIAHGIKGSANYCGAVYLAKVAEELEMAAQDTEQSRVRVAVEELISAADALGSYIKQHYPNVDTAIETGDGKND